MLKDASSQPKSLPAQCLRPFFSLASSLENVTNLSGNLKSKFLPSLLLYLMTVKLENL